MDLSTSKGINQIFTRLYMDGYDLPTVMENSVALAIINRMAETKKINEAMYQAIKENLNSTKSKM